MLAASTDLPAADGLATRRCRQSKLGVANDDAPTSKAARAVFACIAKGPITVDELVDRLGERPESVVEELSMLLLDGQIEQIGPGLYKARH